MKLIIDIPEDIKQEFDKTENIALKGAYFDLGGIIGKAIKNGTPLEVVDELEKVSGKTLLEILASFASDDEYTPFACHDCPLRLKGICTPLHPGKTCYELWLNYLKNNC